MNFKKTTLVIASAALFLGIVGQASASIYARSYLDVSNLTIGLDNPNNTINNFNFQSTNTASLNGSGTLASGASCSGIPGIPGAGTNNCNPDAGAGSTGLNTPGTRSDAQHIAINTAYNENGYSLQGPGALEFSQSDSTIWTSQLTFDASTHIEGLAESELQTGTNAAASAEIQSTTSFTFNFTIGGPDPATLFINFDATWDTLAAIADPDPTLLASAQANKRIQFTLSNDSTGDRIIWDPNSDVASSCFAIGAGLGCTENAIGGNLQEDFGVTTDPNSSGNAGSGAFSVDFTGLTNGDWTFTANAFVSTSLSRQVTAIPEPSILLLLGASFAGMGIARRLRKKSA